MSAGSGRLVRALARGGVAVPSGAGCYAVYRSSDKRRTIVGTLMPQEIAALCQQGVLAQMSDRLVWVGGTIADSSSNPSRSPSENPSQQGSSGKRKHTLLEAGLTLASSPKDKMRHASAASRYLNDRELAASGQVITMNWDLVARGRSAYSSSGPVGQGLRTRHAARSLEDVHAALGEVQIAVLNAVLVDQVSARLFASRFGCRASGAAKIVNAHLSALACAYDRYVGAMPETAKGD